MPEWCNMRLPACLTIVAIASIAALLLAACEDTPTATVAPTATAVPTPTVTPEPTPTATNPPQPSPSPAATSTLGPEVYPRPWPCDFDPLLSIPPESLRRFTFVDWTPDGTRLIFNEGLWEPGIVMASANGSSIRTIVDATPHRYPLPYGYHADISPDGSQLVYSSCQFPTKVIGDPVYPGEDWYHYEIAIISLDGSEPRRLFENRRLDHVPAWSPDGTRIAFVADPRRPNFYSTGDPLWKRTRLYTMAADGTEKHDVVHTLGGVTLSPPAWSPDGSRLSFIVEEEGEDYERRLFLYTVALDGSELRNISETVTPPSWSPDGRQLAFGRNNEGVDGIYVVNSDGTEERNLVDAPGVQQVSWSPNGQEILFVSESVYVVGTDGNGLAQLYRGGGRAAWSPDGSMIAIYEPGSHLVTMNRDGTDQHVLVEADGEGQLRVVQPTKSETATEPAPTPAQ